MRPIQLTVSLFVPLWRMSLDGPPSTITTKQNWTRAGNRGQHFQQFYAPILSSSGLTIKVCEVISLSESEMLTASDLCALCSWSPAEQTDNTVRNKSSASSRGPGQCDICNQSSCVLELGNWREEVKLYQIRGYFLHRNEIQDYIGSVLILVYSKPWMERWNRNKHRKPQVLLVDREKWKHYKVLFSLHCIDIIWLSISVQANHLNTFSGHHHRFYGTLLPFSLFVGRVLHGSYHVVLKV